MSIEVFNLSRDEILVRADRETWTEETLKLVCFVAWQDAGTMWGGFTREQALAALAAVVGTTPERLEAIARSE